MRGQVLNRRKAQEKVASPLAIERVFLLIEDWAPASPHLRIFRQIAATPHPCKEAPRPASKIKFHIHRWLRENQTPWLLMGIWARLCPPGPQGDCQAGPYLLSEAEQTASEPCEPAETVAPGIPPLPPLVYKLVCLSVRAGCSCDPIRT